MSDVAKGPRARAENNKEGTMTKDDSKAMKRIDDGTFDQPNVLYGDG